MNTAHDDQTGSPFGGIIIISKENYAFGAVKIFVNWQPSIVDGFPIFIHITENEVE